MADADSVTLSINLAGMVLPNTTGTYDAVTKLVAALAAAQGEFGPIEKNRHVVIRPREKAAYEFWFADLGEINAKTRPALSKHGLAISSWITGGRLVTALLGHGASLYTDLQAPKLPDTSDELKGFGGKWSYVKRYQISALLFLAAEDDIDDDGSDGREGDDGGATRAADDHAAAAPSMQRRTTATAGAKIDGDGVSWINRKIKALGMDQGLIDTMLARLSITPKPWADLTVKEFATLRSELVKASALPGA
jgi:hypothetical protein